MGWKVQSEQVELVKQRRTQKGGIHEVRWQVAKYKIENALATRGKTLEAGLNIDDIKDLTKEGFLIGDDMTWMIETLNKKIFSLEEIRNHFEQKYKIGLQVFLNSYLKIKNDYSNPTWDKFFNGKAGIEYEDFKTVCTFLDLKYNYNEIGETTKKTAITDLKILRSLLWKLNHKSQFETFQDSANESPSNLVCLRFRQTPQRRHIPIFWLLKALLQPIDDSIERAEIDFNSHIHSNSKQRLNAIVTGLGLKVSSKIENKKKYDAIAKEICQKMQVKKKSIVLLFFTEQFPQFRESEELSTILYESLKKELLKLREINKNQKILIVSIDSSTSLQDESFDGDGNGDDDRILKMDLISQFTNDDIINWTKHEAVNKFIQRTTNNDLNIAEYIWSQSEGKPEDLLKSVYKLCNVNWEDDQDSWQEI
jgi:hypothetical protein